MYVLPAIDILGGRVVRLAKGDYDRVTVYNDDPVDQARIFEDAGASWIHVVDLDGARSGLPENIAIIERIANMTSLNVEVGGGIRTSDTLERFADAGVARMVLGTALIRDPEFARTAVDRFGDKVAAGIDAHDGVVAVQGWLNDADMSATEAAKRMAALGFTHLIYTDIARDGMQTGIDSSVYVAMAEAFGRPVIASGGVAGLDDIVRLTDVSDSIEGVIVGRAIYEESLSLIEALAVCEGGRVC